MLASLHLERPQGADRLRVRRGRSENGLHAERTAACRRVGLAVGAGHLGCAERLDERPRAVGATLLHRQLHDLGGGELGRDHASRLDALAEQDGDDRRLAVQLERNGLFDWEHGRRKHRAVRSLADHRALEKDTIDRARDGRRYGSGKGARGAGSDRHLTPGVPVRVCRALPLHPAGEVREPGRSALYGA